MVELSGFESPTDSNRQTEVVLHGKEKYQDSELKYKAENILTGSIIMDVIPCIICNKIGKIFSFTICLLDI